MRTRPPGSTLSRLLIFLTALALVVAACSSSDDDSASDTTEATSETEASGDTGDTAVDLEVFWFKVNLVEKWAEVTDEYTRENPGVTIETETVGGDQAWLPLLKSKFANALMNIIAALLAKLIELFGIGPTNRSSN